MLRPCPVPGCESRIAGWLLLCRYHWRLVPGWIKREVWRSYDKGRGVKTSEYRRAAAAAIEAVTDAETAMERRAS